MNTLDSLLRGATFRLLGKCVALALSFLMTPFIISQVGLDDYGLWLLLLFVVYSSRFMDLGLSSAVQREIAVAIENGKTAKLSEIVSCAAVFFASLASLGGGVVVTIAYYPELLGVGPEHHHTARAALLLLSLKVMWDLAMCSVHGFFAGFLRFEIDANIEIVNELVRAGLIFSLVGHYKVLGLVYSLLLADVLANVVRIYYVKKLQPDLRLSLDLVKKRRLKELFDYSKHALVMVVGKHFNGNVDSLIVSHLLGLQYVAIYGVVRRLVTLTEGIYLAILGMFMPVIARLLERKESVQREMRQLFSLNLFLVSSFFVPGIVLSNWFMKLWLGPGYEEARTIVISFSLAMMCHCISRPIDTYFLARAEHRRISMISIYLLATNVITSVLLGWYYGLLGVLLGTIVSNYLCQLALKLIAYKAHSRSKISDLVYSFVLANLLMLTLGFSGTYLVSFSPPTTWLSLAFYGLLTSIFATGLLWTFLLCADTKALIFSVLISNFRKVKLIR